MSVALLRVPELSAVSGIVHGFTTREGGASKGEHATLNLSRQVGDEREHVAENRRRVQEALGRTDASWVTLKQVHGADVVQVTGMAGRNIEADAAWTKDRGAMLAVLVADCVPVLIAHKGAQMVATVHAGWRGTAQRIVTRTIERLGAAGYDAADLVVGIGPAIGPCCYQVGSEVADAMRQAFPDPGAALGPQPDGSFIVDLWALNRRAALEAGIREEQLGALQICTSCNQQLFSHRRDAGQTGRQSGAIARQ